MKWFWIAMAVYCFEVVPLANYIFWLNQNLWYETERAKIEATFHRDLADAKAGPKQYRCPCVYIESERRYHCDCREKVR